MRISVRLLFVPLLLILYSLFFIKPVAAQTPPPSQYLTPNTNSDVPKNMHTFTQNAMIEVMAAMVCQLSGIDPINPSQKCLGADPKTGKIGFVEGGGGAIGIVGNMIAMTFNSPVHVSDYFNYLAQNFGIGQPAYAAPVGPGSGFQGLLPLVKVWEAFRNIVYLLFILVFIIVGLLVMLRVKIDPRTVVTLENQLPKIIIAILMVTFSLPLAGLFIDIMWMVIYLVINTISGIDPKISAAVGNFQNFQNLNALEVAQKLPANGPDGTTGIIGISSNMAESTGSMVTNLFQGPIGNTIGGFISGIFVFTAEKFGVGALGKIGALTKFMESLSHQPIVGIATSLISTAIGLGGVFIYGNQILGIVGNIVAFLIISVALLWAMLRLWFELIKAYIFILLDVVLAPFLLLAGVFPGKSLFFGWWVRDIIANLSVFPVTITMFLLGSVFMISFGNNNTQEQFIPPLIGGPGTTSSIGSILGLGVILITPLVVQMMRDVLKAPQFKYTAGMGQALGVAPGIVGGSANAIFSPYGSLATMKRASLGLSLLAKRDYRGAVDAMTGGIGPPQAVEKKS